MMGWCSSPTYFWNSVTLGRRQQPRVRIRRNTRALAFVDVAVVTFVSETRDVADWWPQPPSDKPVIASEHVFDLGDVGVENCRIIWRVWEWRASKTGRYCWWGKIVLRKMCRSILSRDNRHTVWKRGQVVCGKKMRSYYFARRREESTRTSPARVAPGTRREISRVLVFCQQSGVGVMDGRRWDEPRSEWERWSDGPAFLDVWNPRRKRSRSSATGGVVTM